MIEKWEYLQRKAHIKFCWDVIIQGIYTDIELDIKQTWTWICLWTWVCLTKKQVALWKPARNFDCGNLGSSHADRPIYFSPTLLHLNVLPSKPLLLYAHLLLSQMVICKQETTLQAP